MSIFDFSAGLAAGICSAMGVGGGSILLLYLTAFGGVPQLTAQGINLAFFIPTALCAVLIHIKNGFLRWRSTAVSVLFGIPGVFFGSFIAGSIGKELLRTAFALFLLLIGLRELFAKN